MNLSEDYEECTPEELYKWVLSCDKIEGISISGGEPLEQNSNELIDFLRKVKSDSRGLSIIVFSGFIYKEIEKGPCKEILDIADVLVDGTYKKELNDDAGLRGSSNQNIIFLSDRYLPIKEYFYKKDCRNIELGITLDNTITINGIPKKGFVEKLKSDLANEGYELI